MKKILVVLLTISLLFTMTGCKRNVFKKQVTIEEAIQKGQIYESVSLQDGDVTVFKSIIPKGWNANIESDWSVVNSSHPGKETVYISSPDGGARIKIISQQSYTDASNMNEGINYDYYTTYLHYMDAKGYLDYVVNDKYKNAKFVKDVEQDEDIIKQMKEYNKIRLDEGQKTAELFSAQNNINITVKDLGVSTVRKQYTWGNNKIEFSTGVAATESDLESNLSPLLNSTSKVWIIPYFITFEADDEETFDKYYDTYNFIIANSEFTVDYYAMVEYVSSIIVNYYTTIYAERSKASLDAWHSYVDSNYTSTSSQTTNEKVMEMWDDVIKEVDSYKLEDGTQLKTSIYNETVAQNGNDIYIGDKAGIPIGFQTVDKGY